jgi:hypothetical protein
LKVAKGLKADLEALKLQFQGPQEQASRQVVQQMVRVATIAGAWDALNVQGSLEELDREEKSIPGMTQVDIPAPAAPILPPPNHNPGPPPNMNPGPPPGMNPGPQPGANRPPNNRPRPGPRKGANRPNNNAPG